MESLSYWVEDKYHCPITLKGDRKLSNYKYSIKLHNETACNKISRVIPMTKEQHDFRRNRSTIDVIIILKQIAKTPNEYNTRTFFSFIELNLIQFHSKMS